MNKKDQVLYLVDGHALCYRSFFAIRDLTTHDGRPTNAIFGFIKTLKRILEKFEPTHIAVCFDSKKKTLRQEKYAQYKIQRPPMPEALSQQISTIKDITKAYGIPIFELGGFEADDIIATLARAAQNEGMKTVIVSDDKDMYQLVDEDISVFSPRHDARFTDKEIYEKMGVHANQVVDFIALAGDASDNIPGVPGIGKVTAQKLLSEFKDIQTLFCHVEEIGSEKIRQKLVEGKESAFLSRELATLTQEVPFRFDMTQLMRGPVDQSGLFEFFQDLDFKNFLSDIRVVDEEASKILCRDLVGKTEIEQIIKQIEKSGEFVFLVRYGSQEAHLPSDVKGIHLCLSSSEAAFVPFERVGLLKPLFQNEKILKITYDVKALFKLLRSMDGDVRGKCFDLMLASYLLAPGQNIPDIADLSWNYLKRSVDAGLSDYPALETILLKDMYPVLRQEMTQRVLIDLFDKVEIPLARVLAIMETEGVCIDVDLLFGMSKDCDRQIAILQKKVFEAAHEEFNLNSPKQLAHVLFEKLKLPTIKKTKTGFSTNEEVLTRLSSKHAVPALILEYRQISKLKSTYIDALPQMVYQHSGRLHTEFRQTGTETGRLSSRNPNLQNIPVRTEMGRVIRKAFVASSSKNILVAADYSQIELRILAHLSQDQNLIEAFLSGQDIHSQTASIMFGVDQKKVDQEMRYAAKRVNFGIVYGMSAFGLANDLSVSQKEAQEFINRYFEKYPGVKEYMDKMIAECEQQGFVKTLMNRRRYIPEINDKNLAVRQFAQRQAINTPVQGTAADLIKMAMIAIQEQIERQALGSKMIITVHDELIFDVPRKETERLIQLVRGNMVSMLELSVPITVTVKVGHNWLEMKEEKQS